MTPRHTQKRARTALTLSIAAVLGLALGAAGTATFALWSDQNTLTGSVQTGYEYFAAGLADTTLQTPSPTQPHTVNIPSGWEVDAATELMQNQSVAVVFETQSLSQGNKGLSYTVNEPADWGDGIFADADVFLYWVPTPADCDVAVAKPATPDTVEGFNSQPVSSEYSEDTAVVTEYWCLLATYIPPTAAGHYNNTATVTGRGVNDEVLTDTDQWWVDLSKTYDPTVQIELPMSFTYSTDRPQPVTERLSARATEQVPAHE